MHSPTSAALALPLRTSSPVVTSGPPPGRGRRAHEQPNWATSLRVAAIAYALSDTLMQSALNSIGVVNKSRHGERLSQCLRVARPDAPVAFRLLLWSRPHPIRGSTLPGRGGWRRAQGRNG
jgi:hypothetical protein